MSDEFCTINQCSVNFVLSLLLYKVSLIFFKHSMHIASYINEYANLNKFEKISFSILFTLVQINEEVKLIMIMSVKACIID